MTQLTGKDREDAIKAMKKEAITSFGISSEQADKRVNALLVAMDNGLFDGIPDTGPADFMQALFVEVKTKQIMETQID